MTLNQIFALLKTRENAAAWLKKNREVLIARKQFLEAYRMFVQKFGATNTAEMQEDVYAQSLNRLDGKAELPEGGESK